MCGEIEVGTCEVCGKSDVMLRRKYFYYGFKCSCHSPEHFELIRHCRDCEPKEPEEIKATFSTKKLKEYITARAYFEREG